MAPYLIKLKTKTEGVIVRGLTEKDCVSDLVKIVSQMARINPSKVIALKGFPPKPVNLECLAATLGDLGIASGDTLIIEEAKPGDKVASIYVTGINSAPIFDSVYSAPVMDCTHFNPTFKPTAVLGITGKLVKQDIPADNACLFTSVNFVMTGVLDRSCVNAMRQIIAQSITDQPEKYSEAILGKSTEEYCQWILRAQSWGGGIELAVLAEYFKFEIAVVSAVSSNMNIFGETNNFIKRAYLLFDGLHYDAFYLKPSEAPSTIETMFSPMDVAIHDKVVDYATVARIRKKFTNTLTFQLECRECGAGLVGEKEAIQHAHKTGHVQFGEVKRLPTPAPTPTPTPTPTPLP